MSQDETSSSAAPAIPSTTATESAETRANFTGKSNYSTPTMASETSPLNADAASTKAAAETRTAAGDGTDKTTAELPKTSPLLSSTPPSVSRALLRSYPYLLLANKILGVLTWTGDDAWLSILVVGTYSLVVLYFEQLVRYFGHLVVVGIVTLYTLLNGRIGEEQEAHPTLDDAVHNLTTVTVRADMLLSPIVQLSLTPYDLKRLLFTTIFLSPVYIVLTYFLVTPRTLLLLSGGFVLTYHSSWSRITRKILWKSKTVRLLTFYVTGLDFSGTAAGNKNTLYKLAMSKASAQLKGSGLAAGSGAALSKDGPIRFTYVLHENQRRWLGIGWTSNLLSYERAPWTDEFLNESKSTEEFELPDVTDDSNMQWRWVDKTWRLDLTNDGAIQLPSTKPKSTADPRPDDGFIYYDNTWKNPSTEDAFGKYTRKRRWIRTAELVPSNVAVATPTDAPTSVSDLRSSVAAPQVQQAQATGSSARASSTSPQSKQKKRKSLRFDTGQDSDGTSVATNAADVPKSS